MNPAEIRELLNRDPFEPIRIRLTSGDAYDIRDPNTVALGGKRLFIAFTHGDVDSWAACSYLHVAAVESIARGNGRHTRRKRR